MEKILVVDDDASIRKLIVVYMTREGYAVVEASNGQAALEEMRKGDVDLVLLDLMMPLISGWEVLRQRAEEPRLLEIPVIVVSANRGTGLAEVPERGICCVLPKPFDLATLSSLVRGCLESATESDSAVSMAAQQQSDARS